MRNNIVHPNFGGEKDVSIKSNSNGVPYTIENGKVTQLSLDRQSKALIVSIDVSANGELKITLPRKLIDSKNGESDDVFIVLIDGEERDFTEIKTDTDRILTIKFLWDEQEIEIIGNVVFDGDHF